MEDESKILDKLFSEIQSSDFFGPLTSIGSAIELIVSQLGEAVSELKEVDTCLTEISKVNYSLSESYLKDLGENAFDIAGKYGITATDYLSTVKEMTLAGYDNAASMAELAVAIQNTSDISSDLTDQYIAAIDKAYELDGSLKTLSETLNGANNITNLNSVTMTELANGMAAVSSQAASSNVEIGEATAAMGTLLSVTKEGGTEMGNALTGIFMNLQQVTGDVGDGSKAIDETSLSKYAQACEDLGVSLYTVKNGAKTLKEPMQILEELAENYSKLDEADSRRRNLLDAVGGSDRADALDALLENYSLYEKMLQDYQNGTGSMAAEAAKLTNSWEGSMNRLSNTWTDTVGNVVNSDAVVAFVNVLNDLLGVINQITGALDSWGTIGLGAGLLTASKNIGITYQYMESKTFHCFEYALFA